MSPLFWAGLRLSQDVAGLGFMPFGSSALGQSMRRLGPLIRIHDLGLAVFGDGRSQDLIQKLASNVFESRQARTLRVAQLMITTR